MKSITLKKALKYKKEVIIGPLFKVIEVIFELCTPFIVAMIVDNGILKDAESNATGGDVGYILSFGGLLFAFAILGFLFTMICQYLGSRAASGYGRDLRNDIYKKYSQLSINDIKTYGKDKIITLVNVDANNLSKGLAMSIRLLIRSPILVIGCIISSFIINWIAGVIILSIMIVSSFIIFMIMKYSAKKFTFIQSDIDDMSLYANDTLSGMRVVKAFNKEDYEIKKFNASSNKYAHDSFITSIFSLLDNPLTFFLVNLAIIIILYFTHISIDNPILTTGQLISLVGLLNSALLALIALSRLISILTKAFVSLKRCDEFFSLETSIKNTPLKSESDYLDSAPLIEFDNVSLSFSKDQNKVLSNISFDIKAGETVGILGGTGSGKTSLANLLLRFFDPNEGEIKYKGVTIKDLDISSYRKNISLVAQQKSLLEGTIRSNLKVSNPEATDEEMIKALKLAQAYDFIFKHPEGLDLKVEESGNNFSGGQKQRICIARGLLKSSKLIILDDSTSSLDYLTDKKIRNNIASSSIETTIIISQRVTTLSSCDKIIVLDKGKIVAIGSNNELSNTCEIYQNISKMQGANL